MKHILSNMFLGLVAVMTFVIVLRILGWFAIKVELVQTDEDRSNSNYVGVGCGLLLIILMLAGVFLIVGTLINSFV